VSRIFTLADSDVHHVDGVAFAGLSAVSRNACLTAYRDGDFAGRRDICARGPRLGDALGCMTSYTCYERRCCETEGAPESGRTGRQFP